MNKDQYEEVVTCYGATHGCTVVLRQSHGNSTSWQFKQGHGSSKLWKFKQGHGNSSKNLSKVMEIQSDGNSRAWKFKAQQARSQKFN
jgi:hypothetical protein